MKAKVSSCPSSVGLSLAVGLCLLCLSLSIDQTVSHSLRRRFSGDYYGNGRRGLMSGGGGRDWHRGLEHLVFPSSSGQQRLGDGDEEDESSSSNSAGMLFYAAPRFLQQMGRGEGAMEPALTAATAGVVGAEDRMRRSSSLFRPTDREIQQFRESSDWSIPMSSVAKRNLCCSLDMYCVDCSDRK